MHNITSNWTDIVTACFGVGSSVFLCRNCIQLYRDKAVHGISVVSTSFFVLLGLWNLVFYPANGLTFSFIAGIFVVMFNSIWVGQMIYYKSLKSVK